MVSPGAHGVREEPQFVTARAGESVILGCNVPHPLNGQPYVVEWFKYGMPIPFFINFRFYPPHVDPEYAGKRLESVRIKALIDVTAVLLCFLGDVTAAVWAKRPLLHEERSPVN